MSGNGVVLVQSLLSAQVIITREQVLRVLIHYPGA